MSRILLFTGKGGVGKTSVAAATGRRCAAEGLRTLVLSTDPAHSLGDCLDVAVGSDPTPVAPLLDAVQLDAQRRLEESWRDIQRYLVALLRWGGIGEVEAEELAVIPGLEEIFALIDVRRYAESDDYDILIVDCAPTAETLRLLSLPDALGWYMERIFPVERKVAKVVRPVLGRMTTMPLPEDSILGSVESVYRRLDGVRDLLADGEVTSVRLVVNAEKMVVAEARRTYTYLSLFGYHVDAVIVNRLLPKVVTDPWFDRWKALQADHLADIRNGFGDLPILEAPLFDEEVVGVRVLDRLAEAVYGDIKAHAVLHQRPPLTFARVGEGWDLSLSLPFAERGAVDAFRRGDELYVKVAGRTRSIVLPTLLRRTEVVGATLEGGRLVVRFADLDPAADLPR